LKKKEIGDDKKANVAETTRKISNEWKTMSEGDKEKYNDLHEKDRTRYDKQIKDLKENGYYTTEDG